MRVYIGLPFEGMLQFIIVEKEPQAAGDFASEIKNQRVNKKLG